MNKYRCSFSDNHWMTCIALSAESAAVIYANEYSLDHKNVDKFLKNNKKGTVYVNVFNDTDNINEGWYVVEYQAVIICEAIKSKPPKWVKQ